MMNDSKIKKIAKKACLQINNDDLDFFKKSFSAVLPMVDKLLNEKISSVVSMERIISAPLNIRDLSKVQSQLSVNILSKEKIENNSSLDTLNFIIVKKKYK